MHFTLRPDRGTMRPSRPPGRFRPAALTSPVRNRYFYGKLLDAEHLQLEQDYGLDARRLINRLTLGAGVLCGLGVTVTRSGVRILPGVAVDGLGREIVVTDPILVEDPWALTDDCAEPTGTRIENGPVLLCLAYHECLVDPAPVLVADCDLREECVPGAVRERYRLLVQDAREFEPAEAGCARFRSDVEEPYAVLPGVDATKLEAAKADAVMRRFEARAMYEAVRPQAGGPAAPATADAVETIDAGLYRPARPTTSLADDLRRELCESFHPSCAPGPDCVPLAFVGVDGDGKLVVDPCGPRTTIYSNAVLFDLILCTLERLERCCDRKVATHAPVVTATYPAPGASATAADLASTLKIERPGISLTFDQAMRRESLAEPADWLRGMLFADVTNDAGATDSVMAPLRFALEKVAGKTAIYSFAAAAGGGRLVSKLELHGSLFDALAGAGSSQCWVVVQARSDDITQIASAGDSPVILDADYKGTGISGSMLDLLWIAGDLLGATATAAVSFPFTDAMRIAPPPLPTGNGIEGGRLHYWFELTFPKEP